MELSVFIGLGLTLLSGTMMTCAIVPMKFARAWKWENIWLLYIGFGQVVFPLLLICLTAPHAWAVFASAKPSAVPPPRSSGWVGVSAMCCRTLATPCSV